MRKIIFLIHASLDGFVADADGDMSWTTYNEELEEYSHSLHASTDTAIYGRVTYEMMNSYWPTVLTDPDADAGAMAHAKWYDAATKIVFSKTLNATDRKNTIVIGDNIAEEITKIKQQSGKDIWLLGSPSVAQTLANLNLIDEYRINVNPIILGSGKPLFANFEDSRNLKLIEARTFKDGVVGLRYIPIE